MARALESRFRPLFYLAQIDALWPVKTEQQRETVWRVVSELRRYADAAGFVDTRQDDGVLTERQRQWYLWYVPDGDRVAQAMKTREEQLAWTIDHVRSLLVEGFYSGRTGGGVKAGLLEALERNDPELRAHLMNVLTSDEIPSHVSVVNGRARLDPDPRSLRWCIWILAAELVAGGWIVRRCQAPKCGRYIGQWTKRERLFCHEKCRTAFHNASRPGSGKPRGRPRLIIRPADVPTTASAPGKIKPKGTRARGARTSRGHVTRRRHPALARHSRRQKGARL